MANKILLLFLALITAASAKIAVVHSRVSDLPYADKMAIRLNNYVECKRYGIEGKDGLLKVIAENSDIELLVMLSTVTAEDYAKIVREGKNRIPPHVTIIDEPVMGEDLSFLLKNGIVCMPIVEPALAVRGLSNKFNSNILSVGYIYGDNFKSAAANEMALLKSAEIPVFDRRLRTPILSDEFAYGIGKFYTSNVYVYRFLGKEPLFSFLKQEASMVTFVEKRATALIIDNPDYKGMFFNTPVLLLRRNDALLERAASIIILSMLKEVDKKPRFTHPVIIRATSATLFGPNISNRRGENIISGEDALIAQTDRVFQQIKQQNKSADDLWNLCLSSLGTVIDTSVSSDRSPNVIHSKNKAWEFVNQWMGTPIFGYIACGVIFLMFLFKIIEAHQKKRYKRRIALLMPGSVNKISLTGSDGNVVSLKILLESEGYHTKLTSSLKGFKKIMRKNFPNVVVADWDAARVMLQLFYQEFTNTYKFSQVGIILINIPLKKQTQIKKLFGGASVYCYDDVPTLDDVQAHLRGDKHFSSYSEGSYMSGVIHEDNLTAVLQMIEGNMYTGCLVVEEDKPISVIYFKSGRVVYAVDKSGESGVKSIYNALNCRRGNFYFHLNRSAQNETLNLGTIEILMGWAEQRDRFTKKIQSLEEEK